MNSYTPLFPLSKNEFYPHYVSSQNFTPEHVTGYTPSQMRKAYGFDVSSDAKGMKIAVICALDNIALIENTSRFCREFSLPMPEISVFYPDGRAENTTESWITESSLDVQWISVFAPYAEILCIFAKNALTDSILSAVEYAKTLSPDVISMSFGARESGDFIAKNSIFTDTDSVFTASSGNTGGVPEFPSTSPDVLSVGGTQLIASNDGERLLESAWKNGGSGISDLFGIPDFQKRFAPVNELSGGKRAVPDVSMNACDSRGASIYVASRGGWTTAGGTSLACACMAGICACILKKQPSVKDEGIGSYLYRLAGSSSYTLPQYNFYDIILGSNGVYTAKEGWDLCTGLGAPVTNRLTSSFPEKKK